MPLPNLPPLTMATAPLSVHDINRLRAAADENATLTDCWGQETVALVALEWAPAGYRYTWGDSHRACNEVSGKWYFDKSMPVLTADVVTFPRREGRYGNPSFDRHRFWIKEGKQNRPLCSMKWRDEDGASGGPVETFDGQIHTTLTTFFQKLQKMYTTVCVCSHRPQQMKLGLWEL